VFAIGGHLERYICQGFRTDINGMANGTSTPSLEVIQI
jgi:hypothetical protein